jgi:hypothetical protein
MSRLSAYGWSLRASAPATAATVVFVALASILLAIASAAPASAGTTGPSAKVSPDRGLVNGRIVTVSGRGLSRTAAGSGLTWFITECTAAVHGRVNLSADTPHCDVTDAKAVKVGHDGTFTTKFRVRAGILGDGYCGTAGHTTCVIGVLTAKGQGTVVKISFATPKSTATTTSSTTSTTARP